MINIFTKNLIIDLKSENLVPAVLLNLEQPARKFVALILMLALNWFGLFAIINALAFFNDTEAPSNNNFTTAVLDIELESETDFLPDLVPTQTTKREISVINQGTMPLYYDISLDIASSASILCDALKFEVWRNGALLATSTLIDFNLNHLYLATSAIDAFEFIVNLDSHSSDYNSLVCDFDLVFLAQQTSQQGFSDIEIITNRITSGAWENIVDHVVISKVYYNVDNLHGVAPRNEWIELYNPTDLDIPLKKWKICNRERCATINSKSILASHSYALLSHDVSTWNYWEIPPNVLLLNVLGGKFDMDNNNDILVLKDADGEKIDQMNWGNPSPTWVNYNQTVWDPGATTTPIGFMLGRVPVGIDTDAPSDWQVLGLPEVRVLKPNGGEVWVVGHTEEIFWQASSTNQSADSEILISIYYSRNSGQTWGFVGTTTNTGYYSFRLPLFLENFTYYVPSANSRIKIVASGPENFMVQAHDESDSDYCPPIDYALLTAEELDYLILHGLYQPSYENVSASGELLELSVGLIDYDTQHATQNTQQGDEGTQHATDNTQQITDNMQQGGEDTQHATDNTQQGSGGEQIEVQNIQQADEGELLQGNADSVEDEVQKGEDDEEKTVIVMESGEGQKLNSEEELENIESEPELSSDVTELSSEDTEMINEQ